MRKAIQYLLGKFGYRIFRIPETPFDAQVKLLAGIDDPMIFDVGANVGELTMLYRRLFPTARIHAFEPFETPFAELREKTAGDPGIEVHRLALGAAPGAQEFHLNREHPTNSLLPTDPRAAKVWGAGILDTVETTSVDVTTLDRFVEDRGIGRIDLLKLDVQGAEYLVLEGARETLKENRIGIVYAEIIALPTYVGQKPFHEMLRIFDGHGFQLLNLYHLTTIEGYLRQVDAVFVNRQARRDALPAALRAGQTATEQGAGSAADRPGGRDPVKVVAGRTAGSVKYL